MFNIIFLPNVGSSLVPHTTNLHTGSLRARALSSSCSIGGSEITCRASELAESSENMDTQKGGCCPRSKEKPRAFKRMKQSAWPKAAWRSSKIRTRSNRKVDAECRPSAFSGEVPTEQSLVAVG